MADTPTSAEPVIPAAVAKWVWLAYTAASLILLPVLAVIFPENSKPLMIATAAVTGLGALLRMLTTNSFGGTAKTLVVLLVAGSMMLLPGCSLFKPTLKRDLQACAATAVDTEVAAVLPDVVKAIQGDAANWEAQLDTLVANFGQAAICAIAAVVRNLEMGPGGAGLSTEPPEKGGLPSSVLLLRGYAYLSKVK